jgi:3-mercaptopyruvate sulfurtransferase SseA
MMHVPVCLVSLAASHFRFDPLAEIRSLSLTVSIPLAFTALVLLLLLIIRLQRIPSDLRAKKAPTLDPIQLEELMIGNPPQVVDLRSPEEFQGKKGHIRNSVNIPITEFRKRITELETSHPRPIVLVDETDFISHEVLPLVKAQGHPWIYVLKGGYRAWRQAKLPTYQYTDKHR